MSMSTAMSLQQFPIIGEAAVLILTSTSRDELPQPLLLELVLHVHIVSAAFDVPHLTTSKDEEKARKW